MKGGFNNWTTLHESLHFLGLSDRYDENTININGREERTTTPHAGFENDVMGVNDKKNINPVHYQNWAERFRGRGNFILRRRVD